MKLGHLLLFTVVVLLLALNIGSAEPPVTISTEPLSFKPGETIEIIAHITNGQQPYEKVKLELSVHDAANVHPGESMNFEPLGANESKTFPIKYVVPKYTEGILTFAVWLLDKDQVVIGEPGNPYVGIRRFVRKCTTGEGGKKDAVRSCVFKTPAQLIIEAENEKKIPTPP